MKRFLTYGLIIMMALSCADLEEPEVFNDDNKLDGWWYLAALSDTENMTSGEPQLFDEQYTADDTREWRHISGTRFTKYELLFMVGYDIDPETGDFIETHKKYVAEYPEDVMYSSLFMSPGPFGSCIPYDTNEDGERLDSYSTFKAEGDEIYLTCSGGPYTYYWLEKDTPIDDNKDGVINCYDMSWHGRMPRVIPLVDGKDPTTFKVTNVWKRSTEAAFQTWKYTLENL